MILFVQVTLTGVFQLVSQMMEPNFFFRNQHTARQNGEDKKWNESMQRKPRLGPKKYCQAWGFRTNVYSTLTLSPKVPDRHFH